MSYEQKLYKIVEPIKNTTISRLNKKNKWDYGYNKEHDIIVISKTGKIGQILEIQGLRIGLPSKPKKLPMQGRWKKVEYPKELSKLKNIFDWRSTFRQRSSPAYGRTCPGKSRPRSRARSMTRRPAAICSSRRARALSAATIARSPSGSPVSSWCGTG